MKWSPFQKRWMTGVMVCALLVIVMAFLLDAFVARWVKPVTVNMGAVTLSARSVQTVQAAEGTIEVTSIFPKDSPLSIPTGQLLRAFEVVTKRYPHVAFAVDYVDPLVEVAKANALKAKGAAGEGVFFYQAGRSAFVPSRDLCGALQTFDPLSAEEALSAALVRLFRVEEVRVGWVVNHGEPAFTDNDLSGYSGLENALRLEGFSLEPVVIDTTKIGKALPEDMNLLMIVAPQYDFSLDECTALMEWMARGGRLFVSLPARGDAGLSPLFDRWGIGLGSQSLSPKRTVSGGAGLTSRFSPDHAITRYFDAGVTATFVAPRALWMMGAEAITSHVLVEMAQVSDPSAEALPIMIAAERGGSLAKDLIPTLGRMVVAGEAHFFSNRYTLNRASVNRDLFINAMRWLADVPGGNAHGASNVLSVGQDRQEWWHDFVALVAIFPMVFVFFVWVLFRRHQ